MPTNVFTNFSFRQHELQCKHRLVESACGESAGNFSTAVSQIEGRKHNCNLTPPKHNKGKEDTFLTLKLPGPAAGASGSLTVTVA